MTSHVDLDALVLAEGAHEAREDGVCLLEAVAWWAHEPHGDHPVCVSPVLATFGRSWNDALPDDRRHILKEFIPLLPGTAGDGLDLARSYLALDWLVRVHAPAWLDLAELGGHAAALRGVARLDGPGPAAAAEPVLAAAWAAAGDAAWAAARAAAGAAAWDAARNAAWDAAGAAAWDAAWDAARNAAWAAAGAAAGAAARAAAWDAARDAAGDAARAAAWAAAGDAAWDAAWDAARDALAPTVASLQESALGLFRSMLHPTEVEAVR